MRKHINVLGTVLFSGVLLLTGCTSKSESGPKNPQTAVSMTKLETNINKLHEEKPGKILEDISNLDDNALQPMLKGVNAKDYTSLLNTFRQDYESPDDLLKKLNYTVDTGGFKGEKYSFKDNLNVLLLLDASGSMGKLINGETQMNIAKQSLRTFLQSLPSETNVGLRVYGYKGDGTDKSKEKSCASSKLVYGVEKFHQTGFEKALSEVKPAGWTPTALALQDAAKDLASFDAKDNTNIVYLVSDGISTCDDAPIEAAKQLVSSKSAPIVNVIGFNVDSKAKKQLVDIADVSKGQYKDVGDAAELSKEFEEVRNMAAKWKTWLKGQEGKIEEASTFNVVDIFNYAARQQKKTLIEKNNIDRAIDALVDEGRLKESQGASLRKQNEAYHAKVEKNVMDLKSKLQRLNQESYSDVVEKIGDLLKKD